MATTAPNDEGLVFETSEDVEVLSTFAPLGLKEDLLRGVNACGLKRPSALQQRAVLPLLEGRDMLIQSLSGTGKTCTFCLAALQLVDTCRQEGVRVKPAAVLLAPTRELAEESRKVCLALGDYLSAKVHCCIGGTRMSDDVHAFEAGVHIVSGTPGRVFRMIESGAFHANEVKMLVLDEADEMTVKYGFKEEVYNIYSHLPASTQVVLASTTIPSEVLELTRKLMKNPLSVLVKRDGQQLEGIKQFYVAVERERWKFDTLCDLCTLAVRHVGVVIFCNINPQVDRLAQQMRNANFTVAAVHSDMTLKEQEASLQQFCHGQGVARVLIATDFDVRRRDYLVSLVICYDLPEEKELYIHRIGRWRRFSRKGVVINLVKDDDFEHLRDIEQFYSTKIDAMPTDAASVIRASTRRD